MNNFLSPVKVSGSSKKRGILSSEVMWLHKMDTDT